MKKHYTTITQFILVTLLSSSLLACASSDGTRRNERVEKQNKLVAKQVYEEGLNQGIFKVPYTKNFIGRGGGTNTFTHEEGMKEAKGWRTAFPDLKAEVDLILADGDLVSVRWTARGTNTAAGGGIPATGKRVQTSGTTVFRFENGAIAEEWTAGDALGLLRQLGLMGSPPASPATTPNQGKSVN